MEDRVGAGRRDRLQEGLPVDDVDLQQLGRRSYPALLPRGEIVDHGHLPAFGQQGVHEMGADEASPAGDYRAT